MNSRYSIKDLERLSGIKAHTLRIWEQRYRVLQPSRTDTNIRTYNDDDLKRILNISLLNNNGFKISSIAKLKPKDLLAEVDKVLNASQNESVIMATLVISLMNMDESRFEKTIDQAVQRSGFEYAVEHILFPFLQKLGNMWQAGLITPAQEHYISNLIRQKLIVGIDRLEPATNQKPKTVLFFLPDGELHELGLIYAHYLGRKKGHHCVYLGQSLPAEELTSIAGLTKPEVLVSILTAQMNEIHLKEFLDFCEQKIPKAKLLLSGRYLFTSDLSDHFRNRKVMVFKDFAGFKNLI